MRGRSNFFICRECGKRKPGNFFISSSLCKKCSAKRRISPPNPTVEVSEGVLATKATLRRLRRRAESQIPKTWRDGLASIIVFLCFAVFWYVGFPLDKDNLGKSWWPFALMVWYFFLPGFSGLLLSLKLSAPRNRKIEEFTVELARRRKEQIEEAERFYGSPEWNALRKSIINEEGTKCNGCRRVIRRKKDITVDHILPRSKRSELALTRSNLQVLCRRCNSRKGDQLLEE